MTKKKIERIDVMYRKEITWLKWYFLRDKKNPKNTILEQKIEQAIADEQEFSAKKYMTIKRALDNINSATSDGVLKVIKEVYVFKSINVIGACQKYLFLSQTACYNLLNRWFKQLEDEIFLVRDR